jgi:hypothetical protein
MCAMALTTRILAAGPGWSVSDVVCTCGPRDRPYEEWHDDRMSIGAVMEGTFQYRSATAAPRLNAATSTARATAASPSSTLPS